MNNIEYLREQKKSVLDLEKWTTYKANYKQANDHNKNYTSIARQIDGLLLSCANKKITNQDIDQLKTFCNYMLRDTSKIDTLNNMSELDFKKAVVNVYDKCQKVGVVKTSDDTTIKRAVDLVHKRGEATLKDMLLLLFSVEQVENKPPKKEKAKKTIKK